MKNTIKLKNKETDAGLVLSRLDTFEQTALSKLSKHEKRIILHAKEKRFEDYDNSDMQTLAKELGLCMMMLQIKNIPEAGSPYYVLTVRFLVSQFPKLTLNEFTEAICYGIKTIEDDKERHYQSFGVDVISKYINKYTQYTKDIKYKFYMETENAKEEANRKPVTDHDKKIIETEHMITIVKHFNVSGHVIDLAGSVYNYIKDNKKMAKLLAGIKREEAFAQARERIIEENKSRMSKSGKNKKTLMKEIEMIKEGSDDNTEKYLTLRAKRICCEFVLRQINTDELLNDLQTKLTKLKNGTS